MAGADTRGPAPDGGWGWCVALASFVLQMISMGTTLSFGVLFTDLLDYFDASQASTAWIGSIQPAILYLTGLVAAPLNKRLGWRCVGALGAVISSVGFGLSSLVPDIYYLYFTYGLLTGIGNGFMYMTSIIVVQHYFDKKRAMATGIVVAGSGLGTSVFGIVNQGLLKAIKWRMTMLALSGITFTCVFFSLLYHPLKHKFNTSERDTIHNRKDAKTYGSIGDNRATGIEQPASSRESDDDMKNQVVYTTRTLQSGNLCSKLRKTIDFYLCLNPSFALYTTALMLFFFGYHVPYTYTPVRAIKEFGIGKGKASFLVSIMGMTNVISRLLFGFLASRSKCARFYISGTVLTLGGSISVLIFLFNTYPLMVLYCVLFGIFTGCRASLLPVVLVDLLGVEVVDKALGLSFAAASFSYLLASPLSGLIIDRTQTYETPFIIFGAAGAIGGIIFFSILCIKPRGYRKMSESTIDVSP